MTMFLHEAHSFKLNHSKPGPLYLAQLPNGVRRIHILSNIWDKIKFTVNLS